MTDPQSAETERKYTLVGFLIALAVVVVLVLAFVLNGDSSSVVSWSCWGWWWSAFLLSALVVVLALIGIVVAGTAGVVFVTEAVIALVAIALWRSRR